MSATGGQTSAPLDEVSYRGRGVVVLGGAGFIGRWVARYLTASGAEVYLLVRDKDAAGAILRDYGVDADILEVDLQQRGGLAELYARLRPTLTFNLAGYGVDPQERDPRTAYRINAYLLGELCQAAAAARDVSWPGQDIVHVGSALEYGAVGGSLVEHTVPNPTTLYGRSKLLGTRILAQECRTGGLKALTARCFTVYGPGEHAGRLLPSLIAAAVQGPRPLDLTAGVQQRDFTYVEDVAEGLLRLGAAAGQPGEAVNLATGRLTTVRGFVEVAAGVLGLARADLRFGAIPTRPEEMAHAAVSIERLRQLIGWVPSTVVEAGIRQTVAFAQCSSMQRLRS